MMKHKEANNFREEQATKKPGRYRCEETAKLAALQLLIIFPNKSFLTNISLESLHLSKIVCQLRLLSISKSLLLIQKY